MARPQDIRTLSCFAAALLAGCPSAPGTLALLGGTSQTQVGTAGRAAPATAGGTDAASAAYGADGAASKAGLTSGAGGGDAASEAGGALVAADPGLIAPPSGERSRQAGSGLKGGELDDNATFDRYLDYLSSYRASNVLRLDVTDRHVLRVVDSAGKPVPFATVRVSEGGNEIASLRSASDGRVLLFPSPAATGDLSVEVRKGALALDTTLARGASRSATVALPGERGAVPARLDIAFILDVTGSMGDELGRIQRTIGDISARIKSLPSAPRVRFGLVAFRDRGDEYVTRKFAFTGDLSVFSGRLDGLEAGGGGDYPEAVQEAIHDGVSGLDWDAGEALRLMFVVGDAPPHLDYAQDHPYTAELRKAASAGIKIFPVAASGLDNQGEYVFRQLAQYTGGKFLYITYGGDTSHHVGPVQDNNLDDLVVGIVKSELANLE